MTNGMIIDKLRRNLASRNMTIADVCESKSRVNVVELKNGLS
jgi:hypothetical protein